MEHAPGHTCHEGPAGRRRHRRRGDRAAERRPALAGADGARRLRPRPGPPRRGLDRGRGEPPGRAHRRLGRVGGGGARPRPRGGPGDERGRPALPDAGLRGRPGGGRGLHGHGVSLSQPHPTDPFTTPGVKLGDEQFALARRVGVARPPGARRAGHGPGALGGVRGARAEAPVRRGPRDQRPRRRRPAHRGPRLRDGVLHLDHDRGVPQPAHRVGEGAGLLHPAAVLGAGALHLPGGHRAGGVRPGGARGGHPHPARAGRAAGHLQVRAGRGVHQRAQGAPRDRPRPQRPHRRARAARCARGTW